MPLMTPQQAMGLNALELAFMGDTVCDLMTRTELMFSGLNVKDMHTAATRTVNAVAQAAQLEKIAHLLTEDEKNVVQRGRNAHPGHSIPQAASREQYMAATGFEALMGYLFLTGQMNRAQSLYRLGRVKE